MALTPKPKSRKPEAPATDDQKAMNFIRQGGSHPQEAEFAPSSPPTVYNKGRHTTKTDPNDQVSISIKLLVSERNKINQFRSERSVRNKISLQDWIIEAVNEKINREDKRKNKA